jgi:hypothetical protein
MDIVGIVPRTEAGKRFRADLWSWRCIHDICEGLDVVDTDGWGVNLGHGCKSQGECDRLADAIEAYIAMLDSPALVSKETLQEFVRFLRGCGGFSIV